MTTPQASVILLRPDGALILQLDPHASDYSSEFPLAHPFQLELWPTETPVQAAARSLLQHTNLDHDPAQLIYWRTYSPVHLFIRRLEHPRSLRLHRRAQAVTVHGPRDLGRLNVDGLTRRAISDYWLGLPSVQKALA